MQPGLRKPGARSVIANDKGIPRERELYVHFMHKGARAYSKPQFAVRAIVVGNEAIAFMRCPHLMLLTNQTATPQKKKKKKFGRPIFYSKKASFKSRPSKAYKMYTQKYNEDFLTKND